MNRKQIIFGIFLFLFLPMGVSAQQATKADIQALELKMITTITEMDKRLTSQITDLDKQLTALQTTVAEMDKRLTNKISEMDKRVTTQINVLFWAIGALIALVLAVIALPQLLGYFQEKKARSDFQQEIDELKRRLEQ